MPPTQPQLLAAPVCGTASASWARAARARAREPRPELLVGHVEVDRARERLARPQADAVLDGEAAALEGRDEQRHG